MLKKLTFLSFLPLIIAINGYIPQLSPDPLAVGLHIKGAVQSIVLRVPYWNKYNRCPPKK
jgi:hypothetical protein